MKLYLDANILLPMVVVERQSAVIEAFVRGGEHELFISDFAAAEVVSAISRLFRMKVLDHAQATAALDDFDRLRPTLGSSVEVLPIDVREADALVRRFELMLRAPDALHLAMARRLDAAVASFDRRMIRAAQALDLAVAAMAAG